MTEMNIPERCADCPLQCELKSLVNLAEEKQQAATEFAVDDEVPKNIKQTLVDFGLPEDLVAGQSEEITTAFRQQMAAYLDRGDENIETLQRIGQLFTDTCAGQLKMRAATKLGREVTVTVCGSDLAPSGNQHEPVHVKRSGLSEDKKQALAFLALLEKIEDVLDTDPSR